MSPTSSLKMSTVGSCQQNQSSQHDSFQNTQNTSSQSPSQKVKGKSVSRVSTGAKITLPSLSSSKNNE